MGQGTESCTDRPTEVSVIRFVSRNRTIEEIVPKKKVYTCKQRGCGKIFLNQEEYKTHEILEALKIRFICREPGCGEELSDPGSMWRHYQKWHNEANVFVCPYTSCSSTHMTSEYLKEHIEVCHRQPPSLSTEPEIICFVEGPENAIKDHVTQNSEVRYFETKEDQHHSVDNLASGKSEHSLKNNVYSIQDEQIEQRVATKAQQKEGYSLEEKKFKEQINYSNESLNSVYGNLPQNEDLLITKENFLMKYEARSPECNGNLQEKGSVVFVNDDVTITKNKNSKRGRLSSPSQNHSIDLENFVVVFRNGFERENLKLNDITVKTNSHSSNDEEYTPKKQRMSRYKQEPYKCDVSGCGKIYKYISHYRHHQDSHKLMTSTDNMNSKSPILKQEKASTVSFYQCKTPGCGAQANNATSMFKHYQDNHANSKLLMNQTLICTEVFRCKVYGCEMEFGTSLMLCKHLNEDHSVSWDGENTKTGNEDSVRFSNQMIHEEIATQKNFKTELKTKNSVNRYFDAESEKSPIKKKSRDRFSSN